MTGPPPPGPAAPEGPGPRRGPRGRRAALRALLALAVLLALFFGAGGWYFAGQIRSDGLAIERDDGETPSPATPADLTGRAGPIRFSDVNYRCVGQGSCPAWYVPREDGSPGDGRTWAVLLTAAAPPGPSPCTGCAARSAPACRRW